MLRVGDVKVPAQRASRVCWREVRRILRWHLGHGQTLVSSCLSEYVHDTMHEVAINTYEPRYRRQGFATSAAYAYLEHCTASGWTPVWSADGKYIAFDSDRSPNWDVFIIKADGTELTRLTKHPAQDYGPSWLMK